ncbi:MAG TPA: nuclear transport factor 2 family protein [Solirubrobacteraceae bacterium]|nr:nuclear transport factor 2 family protein [Solirubrobacteraceae bacterium]
MSQENVEIVCKALEAFNRSGIDGVLDYVDTSIEWLAPPEWPEDRRYKGPDGLRAAASGWTENFDQFRLDLETAIDAGDHVVALIHQRVRIKGSDNRMEHEVAWDVELRNGKITRVHAYFSWEEALQAVGLEG